MRCKLLEDKNVESDERMGKSESELGHLDRLTKKHTVDIEELKAKLFDRKPQAVTSPNSTTNSSAHTDHTDSGALQKMETRLLDKLKDAQKLWDTDTLKARLTTVEGKETDDALKITELEELLKKVTTEVKDIDGHRLRTDIDHLKGSVHNLASKADVEKHTLELNRMKNNFVDVRDDI